MLLTGVRVAGRITRVRIAGERIAALGPDLTPGPGEETLDGGGAPLRPGVVDHHLHLHALAAAGASARCGPPEVLDAAALAAALDAAPGDAHGWVRGIGYAETVAGDLDAAALDRLHDRRPVRVQHRSGAQWTFNRLGVRLLGLAGADHPGIERDGSGAPTGRVRRADAWLRDRLPPTGLPDLGAVGQRLARHGITAVTDATPDLGPAALEHVRAAVREGSLPQRVQLLGVAVGAHVREPLLTTGPYKIVLADSGLPGFDELVATIRAVHGTGRAVAVHCVTREALVLLLAALAEAGSRAGDRIEHAALVPAELIDELARLGVAVVTQPGFLTDRGHDYLHDVDARDRDDLYRCARLTAAGIPLALSSDAPYGPLDPAVVRAAAVTRRVPGGAVAGPGERLPPARARAAQHGPLDRPGGPPGRVAAGHPADLVLGDGAGGVRALLVGGRLRYEAAR
ncbi:amidohydrolase family protein [Pseudonocardia parietis]|uniref:Amidohydrolase YtcJ n=1 Tax=Pseudonocardia parietis TaxID=570936 RepID=A0ABS4VV08_9PSEU|nr:amidohydrolase family protein [Pseudonocardia parietis]MBP2367767.1 putative amidohydrolase YtcJ [Pseudonocardia parietis]